MYKRQLLDKLKISYRNKGIGSEFKIKIDVGELRLTVGHYDIYFSFDYKYNPTLDRAKLFTEHLDKFQYLINQAIEHYHNHNRELEYYLEILRKKLNLLKSIE